METQEKTKKMNISTPAAIVTAGVIIALALIFSGKGISKNSEVKNEMPTTKPVGEVTIKSDDYILGDISKAEVVIVEYSDSDCPFCQKFHNTMKDLLGSYNGKVVWIYRHFPLNIHPNAVNEAIATECAGIQGGNDAFWKYLDEVIDITTTPEKNVSVMTSIATNIGLDTNAFTKCLSNPEIAKKITDQSTEAQGLGAQGTPYSIAINKKGDQQVIAGAYPIEQLKEIVDKLLK